MGRGFTAPIRKRFAHYPDEIPAELIPGESWVLCDEFKVPLIAMRNGRRFAAKSTDPNTWRTYETAFEAWSNFDHFAGIGRMLRPDEAFVGVDLDNCISETGEISQHALAIIERLSSYAEVSPSGRGVKVWTHAPEIRRSYVRPGLEIYAHGRYFTVTGQRLNGLGSEVRSCGDVLAQIIEEEFPHELRRARTGTGTYSGPERKIDLLSYLERAGVEILCEQYDNSCERKYSIASPWSDEHTNGDTSGTRAGQYADGATWFRCEHSHCSGRTWREFRHALDASLYLARGKGRLR